jgi:cytochrome c peroxidase
MAGVPLAFIGGALAIIVSATFWVLRGPLPLSAWLSHPEASFALARGENPFPVHLVRPKAAPLSALARLGRDVFFDASLSGSGRISCATCHDPAHAYAPGFAGPVALGGPNLTSPGLRPVPSLMYLERVPNFSVGPDSDEDDEANLTLAQRAAFALVVPRVKKTAADTEDSANNLVPQGGMFWDGRADTLQQQAMFPLLSDFEMDGGSAARVAGKLRAARYAAGFTQLFGAAVLHDDTLLVAEAMSAVARFEVEDPSFHPYSSKYDAWLEGRARLSPAELRGYLLYNDPLKADCGGCHLDKPSPDGLPPLFTDYQYEALGAPRNPDLPANRDPTYVDLGICGPVRADMADQTQYCAMFATPTLRNVASRHVFFHNGVFTTLQQVLDFYDYRDVDPARVYPPGKDGKPAKYDDIPEKFRDNVDVTDPPFDRHPGEPPAMTPAEERDIIAFLETLTDGYVVKPN